MIISREEIILSDSQNRMLRSGWGDVVLDNAEVNRIFYESDGRNVEGYLAVPLNAEGKLPLIIWNRGGNRIEGSIDGFLAKGIFGEIASWGYVVLASQYRKDDEFGGDDVNDVLRLINLADKLENCNADLIGMEGWSRGGMMTYRSLCLTERVKCAVIVSGIADLSKRKIAKAILEKIYGDIFATESAESRLLERSAVTFADRICPDTAVLLIHGTADDIVPYTDSVEMSNLFLNQSRDSRLELIEGGDHFLKKFRKEVSSMRRDWFDKYLKMN